MRHKLMTALMFSVLSSILPTGDVIAQPVIAKLTSFDGALDVLRGGIPLARYAELPAASGDVVHTRDGRATLMLDLLCPGSSRWRLVDTETPRNEWDSPNPGTRMVAFEAVAPASGELRLAALLTPGSTETLDTTVEPRPPADWGTTTPVAIRVGAAAQAGTTRSAVRD